jgi:predicted DNA-binding transcriptional regulator YafY
MSSDGRLFWLRATWLVDRLRRRRRTTALDLADAHDLHVQSARRVIESLRSDFGAPLTFDRAAGTWRLDDPTWELPRLSLTPSEVTALALARSLVNRVSAPGIASAMEKLWRKFQLELAEQSPAGAAFSGALSALAPAWAEPDALVMDVCLRGLALGRRLSLDYQSPWSGASSSRTVEPRHLFLYDGSWYLAAHCDRAQGALRLFNLRAIHNASVTDRPVRRTRFRLAEAVDSYGLMLGGERRNVVLRIHPPRAARAAIETWHAEQHDALAADGTLTRTFPVRGLEEVQRLVLSFGACAEVLEPRDLAEAVADEVREMARRFEV